MSKFTLEIRQMVYSSPEELFNFEYDFYDVSFKKLFESKFVDTYYFNEIGFETIERFKFHLRARLNKIMPYYKQLYTTEIEAKKINFLLNKDLKETFIREIDNLSNVTSNIINSNTSNVNNANTSFESATPEGSIADIERYMTTASKEIDNNTSITNDENNTTSSNVGKGTEKTELLSQGNIGITSSGQLLEDWRKTILNIDELIINECKDLFMMVY